MQATITFKQKKVYIFLKLGSADIGCFEQNLTN